MTENQKKFFEWNEVADIFGIREGECKEGDRETLMKRINDMSDKYGRDYVVKKIALRQQH